MILTYHVSRRNDRGPTSDGRIVPTVVAPGAYLYSASSLYNTYADHCGVVGYEGTSMATPATSGTAALIQQYFEVMCSVYIHLCTYTHVIRLRRINTQEGWYPTGAKSSSDKFTPMGALIKAMLVNSARNMTGSNALLNGHGGWYDQVCVREACGGCLMSALFRAGGWCRRTKRFISRDTALSTSMWTGITALIAANVRTSLRLGKPRTSHSPSATTRIPSK
jgi:hypothetical protein